MDILERIRSDHQDILQDLSGLLNAPIDDAEKYSRAYLDLVARVEGHERGEEATIYQAISTDLDVRPIALQSLEEHRVIKGLMRDLAEVEVTEETWLPKLVVLNNVVSLHLQIEEGNILPLLDQIISAEDKEKFDKEFEAEEQRQVQKIKS